MAPSVIERAGPITPALITELHLWREPLALLEVHDEGEGCVMIAVYVSP